MNLSPAGVEELEKAGEKLMNFKFDEAFTSDLDQNAENSGNYIEKKLNRKSIR